MLNSNFRLGFFLLIKGFQKKTMCVPSKIWHLGTKVSNMLITYGVVLCVLGPPVGMDFVTFM